MVGIDAATEQRETSEKLQKPIEYSVFKMPSSKAESPVLLGKVKEEEGTKYVAIKDHDTQFYQAYNANGELVGWSRKIRGEIYRKDPKTGKEEEVGIAHPGMHYGFDSENKQFEGFLYKVNHEQPVGRIDIVNGGIYKFEGEGDKRKETLVAFVTPQEQVFQVMKGEVVTNNAVFLRRLSTAALAAFGFGLV